MTVPVQNPYNSYNANGATTQFRYEFLIRAAEDLSVTLNGTTIPASQYTLSNIGQSNGGNVVFNTAPAAGTLIIRRAVVPQRLTDYQDNGPFLADDVNRDFDRLVMMIQDKQADADTALKHPLGGVNYDALTHNIVNLADPVNPQDAATRKWVEVTFTDVAQSAVQQAQAAAQAASGSASSAAGSASTASTQATNAANSAAAAALSASAAKTSETNAKTSESNAKISENKASTSEANAAGSASAAATSATNAAGSASTASTQATNAAGSATAAAGSASTAAGSANGASSAMTAAQTAQTAAEKARDEAVAASPAGYVKVANNLTDLANRPTAWMNLQAGTGGVPLRADGVADADAVTMKQLKAFNSVVGTLTATNTLAVAPAVGSSVTGGGMLSKLVVASNDAFRATFTAAGAYGQNNRAQIDVGVSATTQASYQFGADGVLGVSVGGVGPTATPLTLAQNLKIRQSSNPTFSNSIMWVRNDSSTGVERVINVNSSTYDGPSVGTRNVLNVNSSTGQVPILFVSGGYLTKQGGVSGAPGEAAYNLGWNGTRPSMAVNDTALGFFTMDASCDIELKKDIKRVTDAKAALNEVINWEVATFKYKARGEIKESEEQYGFIANQLKEWSPETVSGEGLKPGEDINKFDALSCAYALKQVPMLAKLTLAIQALSSRVDALSK